MISNVKQPKHQRQRGVRLTPVGWQRLQAAIQALEIAENQGDHLTLEALSARTQLSMRTLSRLFSLNTAVDAKTLKLCFTSLQLELSQQDYISIGSAHYTETSDIVSGGLNTSELIEPRAKNFWPHKPDDAIENFGSYPDGPVPLNSPFYIQHPLIEELAYREVRQPGGVIRIRAARGMGKSSLVLRLLAFAETQGYQKLIFNCHQIDALCLGNLNQLLRCFCKQLGKALGEAPMLDDYWDEEIGSKLSCSFYLHHLLKQSHNPVVLVLEEVDCLFAHPQIAQEFFSLLRSWYEESRHDVHWQKLRLVVVYATEEYINLDINHSPFNMGLPLHLPQFTQQQVEELARWHGLDWSWGDESAQLMSLVGGHPALIQMALYWLCCQGMTLEQLVQEALTSGGIYRPHLWRHWTQLQEEPELLAALAEVVTDSPRLCLHPQKVYKLEATGLICCDDERIRLRCELYRAYFKKQLQMLGLVAKNNDQLGVFSEGTHG